MRFYLGGPINGCTDDEAHGWREEAKSVLAEYGQEWCDPMDRDYRGRELDPGVANEIVEGDKRDIRLCDVLVMNRPRASDGTPMEMFYGFGLGKVVIGILPEDAIPSPWVIEHTHTIYRGSVVGALRSMLPGLLLREASRPQPVCGPNCSEYTGCDGGCRR